MTYYCYRPTGIRKEHFSENSEKYSYNAFPKAHYLLRGSNMHVRVWYYQIPARMTFPALRSNKEKYVEYHNDTQRFSDRNHL